MAVAYVMIRDKKSSFAFLPSPFLAGLCDSFRISATPRQAIMSSWLIVFSLSLSLLTLA